MKQSFYVETVCDADMRAISKTPLAKNWYADQTVGDCISSYELHEKRREEGERQSCALLDATGWY